MTSNETRLERAAQTKRRRTRSLLLESAARLLQESSYDQLSVSRIASEAGVAPATFYATYPDKASIATDLMLDVYARALADTDEQLARQVPVSERLIVDHLIRLAETAHRNRIVTRAYLRAYYVSAHLTDDTPTRQLLRRLPQTTQELVDELARQDPSMYRRLYVGDLGIMWTVDLLSCIVDHRPSQWQVVATNLLATYFPLASPLSASLTETGALTQVPGEAHYAITPPKTGH